MVSRKKAEMYTKVAEWERSSMSVVAFARTYGITERKFYYWVQKVREATIASDDKPEFIEIGQPLKQGQSVKSAFFPEAEIRSGKLPNPQIELIFPGGLCVKIYA